MVSGVASSSPPGLAWEELEASPGIGSPNGLGWEALGAASGIGSSGGGMGLEELEEVAPSSFFAACASGAAASTSV